MRYLSIISLSVLLFICCETYSTRDIERDNPYPFVLKVIVENNGKILKFEDNNARMTCDRLPTYEECTPCKETNGGADSDCLYDPKTGKSFTADSCMCKGSYHITSQNGLSLIIKDPKKARVPSTFMTQIDAEILYLNKPLNGRIMTTKAEIGTTIEQFQGMVILTDSYFLDIAGGFEATDGVTTLRGGIFYSIKPEE